VRLRVRRLQGRAVVAVKSGRTAAGLGSQLRCLENGYTARTRRQPKAGCTHNGVKTVCRTQGKGPTVKRVGSKHKLRSRPWASEAGAWGVRGAGPSRPRRAGAGPRSPRQLEAEEAPGLGLEARHHRLRRGGGRAKGLRCKTDEHADHWGCTPTLGRDAAAMPPACAQPLAGCCGSRPSFAAQSARAGLWAVLPKPQARLRKARARAGAQMGPFPPCLLLPGPAPSPPRSGGPA
jgi:hypothetical protein